MFRPAGGWKLDRPVVFEFPVQSSPERVGFRVAELRRDFLARAGTSVEKRLDALMGWHLPGEGLDRGDFTGTIQGQPGLPSSVVSTKRNQRELLGVNGGAARN